MPQTWNVLTLALTLLFAAANCRHRPPPPPPSDAERAESAGDQSVARVHAGMTTEEVLAGPRPTDALRRTPDRRGNAVIGCGPDEPRESSEMGRVCPGAGDGGVLHPLAARAAAVVAA